MRRTSDEIEYELIGDDLQAVIGDPNKQGGGSALGVMGGVVLGGLLGGRDQVVVVSDSQGVVFTGGLFLKSPARKIEIFDGSRYFRTAAFT